MSQQTWTIIQFKEERSVEVVPTTWIHGQYCHWPRYSEDKLMTAIKNHERLNPYWPKYKIKSFRNSTFENYILAVFEGCNIASALNSQMEDKAEKNQKVSDNLIANQSNNLLANQSTVFNIGKNIGLQRPELPHARSIPGATTKNLKMMLSGSRIAETNQQQDAVETTAEGRGTKRLNYSDSDEEWNDQMVISESSSSSKSASSSNKISFSAQCNSTCNCCTKLNEMTLMIQNYLKQNITTDTTKLKETKKMKLQIEKISQQININKKERTVSKFDTIQKSFPLNTQYDIKRLENTLKHDNEFTIAINELKKQGGEKFVNEFITETLSKILNNDIANEYNFNEKPNMAFHNRNVCKLVTSTLEEIALEAFDTKKIQACIQQWLKSTAKRRKIKLEDTT